MNETIQSGPEVDSGPLGTLLSRDRVAVDVKISSKKRMLEEMAELLSRQLPGMDQQTVFSVLNERERLGSTGIGESSQSRNIATRTDSPDVATSKFRQRSRQALKIPDY